MSQMQSFVGPEDIRREAITLFASQGFHAVSLRKLALAVGLEVGSLYYHIDSKQALLFEIMEDFERRLLRKLRACGKGVVGYEKKLRLFVSSYIAFVVKNRSACLVCQREMSGLCGEQQKRIMAYRSKQMAVLAEIANTEGAPTIQENTEIMKMIRTLLVGVADWLPESHEGLHIVMEKANRSVLAMLAER